MIAFAALPAVILAGLLSSWHCFAMCGGIVGVISQGQADKSNFQKIISFILYNSGRITSYAIAGFIAGSIGNQVLNVFSIHTAHTIGAFLSGSFMILLGLYIASWWNGIQMFEKLGHYFWHKITPIKQFWFAKNHPGALYVKGMIWGWLPCGLVYSMLVWSITTGSPVQASVMMIFFGMSTLPAIFLMSFVFKGKLQKRLSPKIKSTVGASLIIFGIVITLGFIPHQYLGIMC